MIKKIGICLIIVLLLLFVFKTENTYALVYTIKASVIGGHGTVTPATQTIKPNARAIITIKPDTGYHLESITDNSKKMQLSSPYAIPFVNEDHEVVFTFAINSYKINASVSGGHGTVAPATQTVNHGEKATITITPEEGYKITGILDNGNPIGIANPLVLNNVTANHSIVVAFVSYQITSSAPDRHGLIIPLIQTIQSGGKAVIKITPNQGYQIDKIVDNKKEMPIVNPYIINNVTSEHEVEVFFTTAVLTIKASVAGGHGKVTPNEVKVLYKESITLRIYPDDGYHITGITINGVSVNIQDVLILKNITSDMIVVVSFLEYNIYARMLDDHGTITPTRQVIFYGGKVIINIKSDTGFKINYIVDNGKRKSPTTPTTYVIDNVKEDHLVDISFIIVTHKVTAIVVGGFGTVTPLTQTVKYGARVILNMKPDPGHTITGIMDNGVPKIAISPYIIPSVTQDHTIIVTFLTYAVFASVNGGHGYISPASQYIYSGNNASIAIVPEAGYHIDKIFDNGKEMPLKSTYIIDKISENHSVVVSFVINKYTVKASVSGGHGTVSPAEQTVNYLQEALLNITPDEGYIIESITDNKVSVPIWNPYRIYYTTSNHDIVVKFAPKKK